MNQTILAVLLAASLLLAGCSDKADEAEPILTDADCQAEGLELQDQNGTLVCAEPVPPASVTITGLPPEIMVFTPMAMTWVLDAPTPEAHAMRTEVRWSLDSVSDDALGEPDDWGAEVAQEQHQDFTPGQSYDTTFTPEEPGTYHFRAYALVNGENIWSPDYAVLVTGVQPTGTVHDITLAAGAQASGPSPSSLDIQLGDEIRFVNNDVVAYTFTIDGPGAVEDITVAAQASSEPFMAPVPGSYTYRADDVGNRLGGGFSVAAPQSA